MRWEKVYREHLTLAKLAKRLGGSTHQISEILNHELGTTFSDYVNHYRVEEAKSLLVIQPERTVSAIGTKVGFQSLSSLNRVFKSLTGETPSDYRDRRLREVSLTRTASRSEHGAAELERARSTRPSDPIRDGSRDDSSSVI